MSKGKAGGHLEKTASLSHLMFREKLDHSTEFPACPVGTTCSGFPADPEKSGQKGWNTGVGILFGELGNPAKSLASQLKKLTLQISSIAFQRGKQYERINRNPMRPA